MKVSKDGLLAFAVGGLAIVLGVAGFILGVAGIIWLISQLVPRQTVLTNQQIIDQSNICYKAGYKVNQFENFVGEITEIECGDKK